MDLHLRGRTALVTGASSGIGRGVALELAAEGVELGLVGRNQEKLEAVAGEIEALGAIRPTIISADLALPESPKVVADKARDELGDVEILVNCAGGSRPSPLGAPDTVWEEAMTLNFTALRRLSEAVLPMMRSFHWGRIINISGSMEPRTLNAASSAKAALHLWAKGLSCDIAPEGITVNTIAPGRINSEQTLSVLHPTDEARQLFIKANLPIGYFGEPKDVGALVAFLCSPQARYITGAVIHIDGSMHYFAH